MPLNESPPQVDTAIHQNGQWFPSQAPVYSMNYNGQGWVDYTPMMPNEWMGGYGNMMGKLFHTRYR